MGNTEHVGVLEERRNRGSRQPADSDDARDGAISRRDAECQDLGLPTSAAVVILGNTVQGLVPRHRSVAAVALRPGVAQAEAIVLYLGIDTVAKAVLLQPGNAYLPDLNNADTVAGVIMFTGMLAVILAARAVEAGVGRDLTVVRRTAATGLCMAAIITPGLLMAEGNAFGAVRMVLLVVASLLVLTRSLVCVWRDEQPLAAPASPALPPATSGQLAISGHLE